MGNRATVIFADEEGREVGPAIYLHWNGGPESIYAFLDELDRRQVRTDAEYATARFIHVVGDFLDGEGKAGSLSLGVSQGPASIHAEDVAPFNPGDNGVFVVTRLGPRAEHPLYVRRFTADRGEWSTEQVLAEQERARQHRYNCPEQGKESITDVFSEMRPEIVN